MIIFGLGGSLLYTGVSFSHLVFYTNLVKQGLVNILMVEEIDNRRYSNFSSIYISAFYCRLSWRSDVNNFFDIAYNDLQEQ